jgi:integrase
MRITDVSVRGLTAPAKGSKIYYDDTLKGFGVRVSYAGTKAFILAVGDNRDRTTIGRYPIVGLAEARQVAKNLLAERQLGRHQAPKTTLGAALDLFVEQHVANLAPRTRTELTRLFARYLPKLRNKKLADITTHDITNITDKAAPSEGEHFHRACKTFFRWCVRRRMLQHSPLEGLELPSKWKPRERVLLDDELRAVWNAADATPGQFGIIVKLLILTGQRRSEIGSLQTSWCSLPSSKDGAILCAPASLAVGGENTEKRGGGSVSSLAHNQENVVQLGNPEQDCEVSWGNNSSQLTAPSRECTITIPSTHTKNKRTHSLPIGQCAKSLIESLSSSTGYLFPARGMQTPFNGWSKAKAQLDKKVADQFPDARKMVAWTLHDLRRTYATNLQRLGIKTEVIEALLNHISGASRSGVAGIYQRHQWWDEMREAVTIYEDWFRRTILS